MFILFFINSKPLEEETHPLLPKTSNLIVFLAWSSLKTYCLWKVYVLKSSNLHCNLFLTLDYYSSKLERSDGKKGILECFFVSVPLGHLNHGVSMPILVWFAKSNFFYFFFPFLQLPRSPLCYVCFLSCEINLNSFWKRGDNIKS